MEESRLGPKTDVTVVVDGSFTLPLHLAALESLEDPILQDEIVKEATRLALAERLGGFDEADISTGRRNGAPVCNVRLNFADLACAIANIQQAYNHIVGHVQKMQEVVNGAQQRTEKREENEKEKEGDAEDTRKCFETLASLAKDALSTPIRVPLAEEISSVNYSPAAGEDFDDRDSSSPLEDGYKPLLDHEDDNVDVDDHQAGRHAPSDAED